MARVAAVGIWAEALPEVAVFIRAVLTMAELMAVSTGMAPTMVIAVTTGMASTTDMPMVDMAALDGAEGLLYISAGPGMVGRGHTTTQIITRPLIPLILPDLRQTAAGIAATIHQAITLMFRRAISRGKSFRWPLSIMPTAVKSTALFVQSVRRTRQDESANWSLTVASRYCLRPQLRGQ